MGKFVVGLLFVLLVGASFADVPSPITTSKRTTFGPVLAQGDVTDTSNANTQGAKGVPGISVVQIGLDAPVAPGASYYVTTASTGTSLKTLTLAHTVPPDLTAADGQGRKWPISRNVSVTMSGATTATITMNFQDTNNVNQTATISYVNETSVKYSAFAVTKINSITVLSSVSRNITVGTGYSFGMSYPFYILWPSDACLWNSAGNTWSYAATTSTFNPGVPNGLTANNNDRYGTVEIGPADNPPNGTADFVIWYLPTEVYGVNGSGGFPVWRK